MRQEKISKELVELHRRENNMTVDEFCKECGITRKTYDKIMNGEECNVLSILRIALRMSIKLEEIFPSCIAE